MRRGSTLLAGALLVSACSAGVARPPNEDAIPLIVDYSPTVSDVAAFMYLLAHPDVHVIAVSLPATGEAGCRLGAEVTFGILAMYDRMDVPVACGPEVPGARSWPEAFLDAQENLAFGLPDAEGELRSDAGELIAEAARGAWRPAVVWAVAPLTNVADALTVDPDIGAHLDRIVIMGGAVEVPGNVQGTGVEWNLWIDVPAAARVIGSEVPITLVPLDATNDVPVPIWYRRVLDEAERSQGIAHLRRLVHAFPAVRSGFFYLWDELAGTVAAGETLVDTEDMRITVVEGGPDDGRTKPDPAGRIVTVATGTPDPNGFYEHFLETLAGADVAVGGGATPEEAAYFAALEAAFANTMTELAELNEWLFTTDTYDPERVVEGMRPVFQAIASDLSAVAAIDPPGSLAATHSEYLDALTWLSDSEDEILGLLAASTSFEELGPLFERYDEVCFRVIEEAALRGLSPVLPCG